MNLYSIFRHGVTLLLFLTSTSAGPLQVQKLLTDGIATQQHTELAITSHLLGWFNDVNISIGTPPQHFRAVIDIGWTDLLIPSEACRGKYSSGFCGEAENLFNSSASSTDKIDHGPDADLEVVHSMLRWFGTRNSDVLHVGGIRLSEQSFLSAEAINGIGFVAFYDYDAVLGLPRYPSDCERHSRWAPVCGPGPFHAMIEEHLLDRNLFALRFPNVSAEGDSSGTLDLGFINSSSYAGELMTFPVSDIPKDIEKSLLPTDWHVDFSKISFGSASYSFPNFHAVFITIEPFIYLPRGVWEAVADHLFVDKDERDRGIFLIVDCDRRHEMPDIHFTLGPDGVVVTLTSQQYVTEVEVPGNNGTHMCTAPFLPLYDEDLPPWEDGGAIGLGTLFLKSFYSVFDVDDNSISLGLLE